MVLFTRSRDGREGQEKEGPHYCSWIMEIRGVKEAEASDHGIRATTTVFRGMRQRSLSQINEAGFITHM